MANDGMVKELYELKPSSTNWQEDQKLDGRRI
jgi:hypothetical protein